MNRLPAALALAALVSLSSVGTGQDARPKVDFAHDVLPVIKAKCAPCHTNGTYKGGVSMDTRADIIKSKAVVSGQSGKSELVKRITSADPEYRMPPKGPALSEKEVAALK